LLPPYPEETLTSFAIAFPSVSQPHSAYEAECVAGQYYNISITLRQTSAGGRYNTGFGYASGDTYCGKTSGPVKFTMDPIFSGGPGGDPGKPFHRGKATVDVQSSLYDPSSGTTTYNPRVVTAVTIR